MRKYLRDLFVQQAFGDHGQTEGRAHCKHHHQKRCIAGEYAGQRSGAPGIHHNHRNDGRRPGQQGNGPETR